MRKSYSKIRHIQESNERLENRFLIKEDMEMSSDINPEGRNNPAWVKLVSSLRNLSFPPKILTFDTTSKPSVKSQSLNWGTAVSRNGNYALAILVTDNDLSKEEMDLFSDNQTLENEMYKWWISKGYKKGYGKEILINYKDADKLKSDMESFFKVFPPVGKISAGIKPIY
jgi:hypothetical protein